jgi:hypothetical protein
LAIEVEVSHRSENTPKIYAKLGVPEVWRYDGRMLWFGRLCENGKYETCDRSPGLPLLTPHMVLGWMRRAVEGGESEWLRQLTERFPVQLAPKAQIRKK